MCERDEYKKPKVDSDDRWEKCSHYTRGAKFHKNSEAVILRKRALNVSLLLRFSSSPFQSEILFSSYLLTSVQFIDQLSHLVHRFKICKVKKQRRKEMPPEWKYENCWCTLSLLLVVLMLLCTCVVNDKPCGHLTTQPIARAHTTVMGKLIVVYFFLFLFLMFNETVRRRVTEMQNKVNASYGLSNFLCIEQVGWTVDSNSR